MGTVTPVNGELDVNRLGTSRLEVDEVGVGEVGVVESISSCRQVDLQGVFMGIWGGYTRR